MLNPKAIKLGELYGEHNLLTNEWSDGLVRGRSLVPGMHAARLSLSPDVAGANICSEPMQTLTQPLEQASSLIRAAVADTTPSSKWVVFDGPVDAVWVESMNTG